MNILFERYKNI